LLGGLIIAFTRVKLGFIWAIINHAISNAMLLIPFAILVYIFPEIYPKVQDWPFVDMSVFSYEESYFINMFRIFSLMLTCSLINKKKTVYFIP
jgi:hypothetical protein